MYVYYFIKPNLALSNLLPPLVVYVFVYVRACVGTWEKPEKRKKPEKKGNKGLISKKYKPEKRKN